MNHDIELVLQTIVAAVFFGILAQVLAQRFKLPAILPLLLFGMGAGPFGLNILDPQVLGHDLEVYIHLGVAIILFEGGLSLDLKELRQVGGSLRNLLIVGTLVTAVGAAILAHYLVDVSWSTAALFGAIVTVTGPTVIVPLLRHMIVPQRVRTTLISEGLMIDPIGAVLAYFVLQWIERAGMGFKPLFMELLTLAATGTIIGFAAGSLAVFVIRYRHMDDELRNLVTLATLLGSFFLAELQAPQSGILASVVMGLTVSAAHIPDLTPLKAFKGQLTVLVISVLFVLLSGQLDLEAVRQLGLAGIWVVVGLIFVIRPLAVLFSIPPSELDWKEKLVLALNAPRGIVAAAVASVSAIQLRSIGADGDAAVLEGLVYLVILATCTWSTLMAPLLPRFLGYIDDPARRRLVLVGAHSLSVALTKIFRNAGWHAVVVDSVTSKVNRLRDEGIRTVCGDARDAGTYEEAETSRDSNVLALTTNDELNLLVAELVREEFGVEHPVVALHQPSKEFGSLRRAWVDLLSGRGLDLSRWVRRLDDGKAAVEQINLVGSEDTFRGLRSLLRERPNDYFVLCLWSDGRPVFRFSLEEQAQETEALTILLLETGRERLEEVFQKDGQVEENDNEEPTGEEAGSEHASGD